MGVPEKRTVKSLGLTDAGVRAIQEVAAREGISWNEAARRCLKWATGGKHPKPHGWH